MEKIKKILSPGSSKDDEVLYGNPEDRSSATGAGTSSNTDGLAGQGSHFGSGTTSSGAPQLQSQPAAEKDDGMLRQVLNPGGDKADDTRYGQTATAADPNATTAARTATGTALSPYSHSGIARGVSTTSIKSGIEGPYSRTADTASAGTSGLGSSTNKPLPNEPSYGSTSGSGLTGQSLPDRSAQGTTASSHLGRDAGLGGAGAGAAGVGAYEYEHNKPSSTDRSFPLGGGSTTSRGYDDPSSRTGGLTGITGGYDDPSSRSGFGNTGMGSTGGYNDQSNTSGLGSSGAGNAGGYDDRSGLGNTGSGLNDGREGLASAAAGAGAGGLAGGALAHEHGGHGHQFDGHAPGSNEAPVEGYVHHAAGPHATDTANRLDPHIPGEFPTESGVDRHSHMGRDTALAGGAGAGGLGAYEAEKHRRADPSTTDVGMGYGSGSGAGYDGTSSGTGNTDPSTQHHYGRDAGLAGGAGAAGLGAYELEKGRKDTGPASKTIGPHSSNVANVVDPRVKPDPALMKGNKGTSGDNYDSTQGTDPTSQHHYGRDAALGGAGAAGLGGAAYEADKHYGRSDPMSQRGATSGGDYPTSQTGATSGSNYPTSQTTDPSSQHHYGRDAALGGAGAAGLGGAAYEADKHYGRSDPMSQRGATSGSNYPTSQTGATGGSNYPTPQTGATSGSNYPTSQTTDPSSQHHYGRDAALGGAGAAGLGGAAYEAEKHRGGADPRTGATSTGYPSATSGTAGDSSGYPTSQTTDPSSQHHYGRDAALGGAGAAGVGGAAYEAEKHHDRSDPTATAGDQTQDKHHYGRDAAAVGGVGAAGYAADKEYDQHHEKELEKARQKEAQKAEKKHEKEEKKEEKAEKKHEKGVAKEHEKEEKPKKEGFIHKLLHHGDKDKEEETGGRAKGLDYKDADEAKHARNTRDLEATGAGGAIGVGGEGYEAGQSHGVPVAHDASGHTKLHKDPPADYAQDSRTIDPHTGLPVDLSKGTGEGGTDGSQTIHGYGQGSETGKPTLSSGLHGETGPDWEKIRNANTPY